MMAINLKYFCLFFFILRYLMHIFKFDEKGVHVQQLLSLSLIEVIFSDSISHAIKSSIVASVVVKDSLLVS